MRYFLPYLLLALAAFQSGATLLLPLAQLGVARSRAAIRLGSRAKGSEMYVLGRADFESGRSGQREWWHDGQLYDLQEWAIQGDSVRLTALPDAREQCLLAGFQRLFGAQPGPAQGANPLTRWLVQLLAQPFLSTDYRWTLRPPTPYFSPATFLFQAGERIGFARIFSPPPDGLGA
ncbi:MAG: hypothetical protein ABIQ93_09425 [Saprospiraceae bacterium]